MGQEGNSGRQANLDDKKNRAAGRRNQKNPERQAIKDWQQPVSAKGKTAGAFGKASKSNRQDSGAVRGGSKGARVAGASRRGK